MALEDFGKDGFAEGDRTILVELVETVGEKRLFGGLDDEGRRVLLELVDMRLEPALLGLAEIEGEGVEPLVGAEPDVAAWRNSDIGTEGRRHIWS